MVGCQQVRQIPQSGSLKRTQNKLSSGMFRIPNRFHCFLCKRQNAPAVITEHLALCSECHAALIAVEQRLTQFFFQLFDPI